MLETERFTIGTRIGRIGLRRLVVVLFGFGEGFAVKHFVDVLKTRTDQRLRIEVNDRNLDDPSTRSPLLRPNCVTDSDVLSDHLRRGGRILLLLLLLIHSSLESPNCCSLNSVTAE